MEVINIIKQLFPVESHNRIFLVGGSLRDALLGVVAKDIDLVAALSAEELITANFRTVTAKTTTPIWFRSSSRYGKIEVVQLQTVAELEADLTRRDFKVNAIAMDLAGKVIDPLNGSGDLSRHLLDTCSDDAFKDDPLRIFRAIRFESDGWQMTEKAEQLIREQSWEQELEKIPIERFSAEMIKALSSNRAERFFERMLDFNIGLSFLPELFRMPQIPAGSPNHHPEGDLFRHSTQVLQRVARERSDPLTRFSAFFHDIGKLLTAPGLYPKHHGHDSAGVAKAIELCKRLKLPMAYATALAFVSQHHLNMNRWSELREATKIRIATKALKAGTADILAMVSVADKPGNSIPDGWETTLKIAAMSTEELGINTETVLKIKPEKRGELIMEKKIKRLKSDCAS